jgi:hypothetical protein
MEHFSRTEEEDKGIVGKGIVGKGIVGKGIVTSYPIPLPPFLCKSFRRENQANSEGEVISEVVTPVN